MEEENINYFISIIDNECKKCICVGYVNKSYIADLIVQTNRGNILNNARYAIIEKVKEGIFMYDEKPTFYEVKKTEEDIKAKRMKNIPNIFKNKRAIGFGLKM